MSRQAEANSLEDRCVSIKATLGAIATISGVGSDGSAVDAADCLRTDADPTHINGAIMAMQGLAQHVPGDHEIPLREAIAGLEADGVCGRKCMQVARLIDQAIVCEKRKRGVDAE